MRQRITCYRATVLRALTLTLISLVYQSDGCPATLASGACMPCTSACFANQSITFRWHAFLFQVAVRTRAHDGMQCSPTFCALCNHCEPRKRTGGVLRAS
jgi:hypothetical protein